LRRSVIGALLGQGADVIDIEDDHPARVAAALSARRAGRDWPRLVWVDDWLGENADNDFTEDGTARPLTRLIALLQAVASVVGSDPIEVWAVTTRGLSVAGEASDPRAAMLAAPVLVASQEVLNLAVRLVDVEDLDTHADALAREVLAVTPRPDRVIGLRGRHAWAERFEPMEPGVGARERGRRRLVESGPHLLIGGNGRIGGAIARHCAAIGAEVVACARSTPPDGVPWRAVRCDVTDEARLYQVLDEAAGGGRLGVVFHAAGLADLKYLEAMTPASIAAELDAKVAGTQALSRALDRLYRTRSVRPEAVVLFGSLAGLIGGYGMAAYGAANRYLDAIAEGACNGPVQWIAIDWDDWNFDYGREQTPVWERRARAFALGRQEGVAALETILGEPRLSRVAVAGSDLERRRRAWCVRGAGDQGQFAARSISAGAAPPSIHTHAPPIPDTVADEGELLRHVLEAYAEVLGGDGLAADSDFFDLGGDSLTAARLALALKRRLAEGSDVRLALVLEHATPGALASALAAAT
ncbi:MAG: SDR family oxidoreductase, partial [Hyphomicrobiaceae bacterium]|nr:SDR family oxidoreductase [Hyphomicrobiaceae bacterium]